jgi:hypothetical protein
MNLKRMFANAIVRRVAFVVVALLFTWAGMGRAEAAGENCFVQAVAVADCPDRGKAVAAIKSFNSNYIASNPQSPYNTACVDHGPNNTSGQVAADSCGGFSDPQSYHSRSWPVECVSGTWNQAELKCETACADRQPIYDKMI